MRSEILKKDKLDIIKQKTSASRYHQESEKTTHRRCLQNITDKGLVSRLHKELLQLNDQKTDNPIKNGQMIWTDFSPEMIYKQQ